MFYGLSMLGSRHMVTQKVIDTFTTDNKQIFDKKNRISKIIQSSFDDIRRSEAESNIIKARD